MALVADGQQMHGDNPEGWIQRSISQFQNSHDSGHWWCSDSDGSFKELLELVLPLHDVEVVVQTLCNNLEKQLGACLKCLVAHHESQELWKARGRKEVLGMVQRRDAARLSFQLATALQVQGPDEDVPPSLMLALYESLHFDSLEDADVMEAGRKALLHLTASHELRLADTGPPPGLYRLLAHHDTNLRSMMLDFLPNQIHKADVLSLLTIFRGWAASFANDMQQVHRSGRPRYQQQKGPAWLALNHVLKRMRHDAMTCLLEHLPQLIWLAIEHSCSLDQQTNWAAVECLHSILETLQGTVWKFTSCSPSIALDRMKSAAVPSRNLKLLTALGKVMKPLAASMAEFEGERQTMWPKILCFLLHDNQHLAKPAGQLSLTFICEQTAIGMLMACHDAGYSSTPYVHIYGPALIRLARTHCSSSNHGPAVHFLCKLLTDDAAVLREINDFSGQAHAQQARYADWRCSPALWKECGQRPDLDPQVYSAIILSAALLSRTRGSQAASNGPAGGGAGFQSFSGFQSLPFYTAMEWPQSWDPSSQQSYSAVRVVDYPGLLLEHVRSNAGMVLSRSCWDLPGSEIRETASALAHLMVGVDGSLLRPAEQTLLRISKQPSLDAFFTGKATDALQGFLAALEEEVSYVTLHMPQVLFHQETTALLLLLERLVSAVAANLHHIPFNLHVLKEKTWCLVLDAMQKGLSKVSVPAAQPALTAAFRLLPNIWALMSGRRLSSSRTITEDALLALGDMSWLVNALLWGLQCPDNLSEVWVSSLIQILDMLPTPINAVLPEECLEVARRVLAPGSCLSDDAKLRLASHFSSVAPGNIGQKPLQGWPSHLAAAAKPPQAVHSRNYTSPQQQKPISAFLKPGTDRVAQPGSASSSHQAVRRAPAGQQTRRDAGRERSWHSVTDADVQALWPADWPSSSRMEASTGTERSGADSKSKAAPLSKLKAAISKMEGSGAPAMPRPNFKRPSVRSSAAPKKDAILQKKRRPNRPLSITPDRDLDAELDRKRPIDQQDERSKLGLPLAPKPQRKMIQLAAPPDNSTWAKRRNQAVQTAPVNKTALTMDIVKRDMLGHSISDILDERPQLPTGTTGRITWGAIDVYSNTFHELLLDELRSNIKQALEASQRRSADHVLEVRSVQKQSELHAAELLFEASDEQPFRGSDMLLLGGMSQGTARHDFQLLVLVESVERDEPSRDRLVLQVLLNLTPKDSGVMQQEIQTAFLPRTKWQAQHLLSCVPHLRQFQALCRVGQFPPAVLSVLLQPKRCPARSVPGLEGAGLPKGLQLALQRQHNPSQQAAIAAALDRRRGLVSLIQGPPGSGKTSTIGSVVSSFLSSTNAAPSEQPSTSTSPSGCRVLVCAQSNAAVDELALRLSRGVLDASGKARSASVVRLGLLDATSNAVQALHIDTLSGCRADKEQSTVSAADRLAAAKDRRLALGKQLTQVRADIDKAAAAGNGEDHSESASIERTPEEQPAARGAAKAKLDALHNRRRQLTAELHAAKEEVQAGGQQVQQASRAVRAAVIKEAEAVVCTLSSAGGELLAMMAAGLPSFDAVIIDEAAQAVEPAALIPLQMLKPDGRVVLVGDPKQLPATVVSRAAEAAGLSRSLFERLQQAGMEVSLLAEQYRMHPAISAWPASYFYAGHLKDAPAVLGNARSAPFHTTPCFPPLAFFDCRDGKESRGCGSGNGAAASIYNYTEVDLACSLFTGLMKEHGKAVGSVAVLSSYKAQVTALRALFTRVHGAAKMAAVEFNTIDGFQGREADVVIFSCVRARASQEGGVGFLADGRRMNVAFTRARQSLWIIGHVRTLRRCAAWAALIQHAAAKGCLFAAVVPFEQLLRASHEELTAGVAQANGLVSSRQKQEKRRSAGSREEIEDQQPAQKRPRSEHSSRSLAAASVSRSRTPPATANRVHTAVDCSADGKGAGTASSGGQQSAGGASTQRRDRPANQQEPALFSELQGATHRQSAAGGSSGDKRMGQADSRVEAAPARAQSSAGSKVTVFSNPLLQRERLLAGGAQHGPKHRRKPAKQPAPD